MDPLKNPNCSDTSEESFSKENVSEAEQPRQDAPRDESSDGTPKTGSRWSSLGRNVLVMVSVALVLIAAYCIVNIESIKHFIGLIGDIVAPLIIGAILAYLCNPILEFYEYRVLRRMKKGGLRLGLSLLFTILTALAMVALLVLMIVPKLVESISDLAANYQVYAENFLSGLHATLGSLAEKNGWELDVDATIMQLEDILGSGENLFNSLMNLMNKDNNLMAGVGSALVDIVTVLKNWLLGIFIAFYLLSSKEKRVAQTRKMRRALFNEKQDARITEVVSLADRTFSGYVFGILIDALVVGVMTFILLSIFKVSPKYNLLISAICAATNIIPVFGPFIGAIPSALIVLISNPSKFILFIFLVLVIQQIDGNLLCPKIQGDNTGVSSLAVLIAITIAGSIGGILGMIIGVPIFAVIIELFKRFLEHRLEKKGEPTDTIHYYPADALGNAEKDVYYEHASLRYEYEHSKLKPRFERFKRRFMRGLGYKGKDNPAAGESISQDTPTENDGQTQDQTDPPETDQQ